MPALHEPCDKEGPRPTKRFSSQLLRRPYRFRGRTDAFPASIDSTATRRLRMVVTRDPSLGICHSSIACRSRGARKLRPRRKEGRETKVGSRRREFLLIQKKQAGPSPIASEQENSQRYRKDRNRVYCCATPVLLNADPQFAMGWVQYRKSMKRVPPLGRKDMELSSI